MAGAVMSAVGIGIVDPFKAVFAERRRLGLKLAAFAHADHLTRRLAGRRDLLGNLGKRVLVAFQNRIGHVCGGKVLQRGEGCRGIERERSRCLRITRAAQRRRDKQFFEVPGRVVQQPDGHGDQIRGQVHVRQALCVGELIVAGHGDGSLGKIQIFEVPEVREGIVVESRHARRRLVIRAGL